MADDDDDDFFGDFKFAPTPPSYTTSTATTINTSANANGGCSFSDDDWGDFVTTRYGQIKNGFELSNGKTIQSPVGNSADVESAATRGESAPSSVKPRGPLPLSLFGETEEKEEEEEEESGVGEPTVGDALPIFFHKKDGDAKNGSALNGGVEINDLLANLYSQSQQIKVQNGLDVNGANSSSNESGASVDGLRSSADASNWHQNGFDSFFHYANQNSNGLDSSITGITSNSNGLNSDLVEQSENFDDDDDDDGWEFKGAHADKQGQVVVQLPGIKVQTVEDQKIQHDGRGTFNIEEPGPTIGLSNGATANGAVDISIQSDETPHRASDWNFVFDFNPSSATQNFSWDLNSKRAKNNVETGSVFSSVVENGNSDENFWQFKDAFPEAGAESKSEAATFAAPSNLGGQEVNGGGPRGPTNLFATPEGTVQKHQEWDFVFSFNSSSKTEDSILTDKHSSSNNIFKGVNSSPNDTHDEFDDNVWEFRHAFSETGLKNEGESAVSPDPSSNVISPAFDGANQGNEIKLVSHRESLPLSIFCDEEVETDASTSQQDVSIHEPASYTRNSKKAPDSNLNINDLIASLYGQAQQSTSSSDTPKLSENEMPSTSRGLESDLVYLDDDFDEDSWEFKDASFDAKAQEKSFATDFEDSSSKYSTKFELNDYVDFYCKLKDSSRFVAFSHFENLKKAQSAASVSGAELRLEVLDEEIQKFHDQLCQETMISEFQSENLSPSTCLAELFKVLEKPKFKVLESEYQLSKQLSLAEKDLGSAIELLKHATSTIRVLKLGSAEEQSTYVSTWSKIVSVCAQELKHGALIWKQALQKNVQDQLLSEPQGMRYIIALGEIYRVVQVIGASTKLYKPWVLLDSEESSGLFLLLNECVTLWSTSGLDDALQSMSESINAEFDVTLKELLESMKYIHDLDALALQNQIFSGDQQPLCRLSLLTAGVVPGIKMVVWDGRHYFLKLVNLWANLITSNPIDLPHFNDTYVEKP